MRWIALAAVFAGLCACGAGAASIRPTQLAFGAGGGNMVPFQVTIESTGRVRASGFMQPKRHRLSRTEVASLFRLVAADFGSGLRSRRCRGTNPDIGSDFVRGYGRTVSVHGSCEPRFHRLWTTLARAVALGAS